MLQTTSVTSTGLDFLLLVLQIYAFVLSTHYVIRYWKFFIGKRKIFNIFLRSIWESEIGFALLCLTLIWISINSMFVVTEAWLLYSSTVRKIALAFALMWIIHNKLNLRDVWDTNRKARTST